MKGSSFGLFFVLFMFIGTSAAFMYLGYSSSDKITNASLFSDMVSNWSSSSMTLTVKSRKLKEIIDPSSYQDDAGRVSLEDYRPIDPSPSSKASVRPGPIQHGTPLMPFIPRPSPPPTQPKHG